MNDDAKSFSERHGFYGAEPEITIREDAPHDVRFGILMLGKSAGLNPHMLRSAICEVLLKPPDINRNWSAGNVEQEVHGLIDEAPWFRIYDFAEKLYAVIRDESPYGERAENFEDKLNKFFRERGVGWQMDYGRVVARGSESFGLASKEAVTVMLAEGKQTAANEIHEALKDISRRPEADVTGAIQHAIAALECVARDFTSTKATLGAIIKDLPLTPPLNQAVSLLWGFASEQGRHLMEGRDPHFEDAELVVTIASALSVYLLRYAPPKEA